MANEVEILVTSNDRTDFNKLQGSAKQAAGGLRTTFKNAGTVAGGILVAELSQALVRWGASAGRFLLDGVGIFNDTEEALNKVNAVFGKSSRAIEDFSVGAAKNLGLSKREALDATGTFGNMFRQLGLGEQHAASLSQGMVTLASDFASFHNADITDVLDAQSAAFRGEYDSLQRFLPLINAATVEQKALEQTGKASNKELTAQEKALAVNTLMFEGAGQAIGDFQRTSEGAANQERILAAELENTQAALGEKLAPWLLKVTELKLALVNAINTHLVPALETAVAWIQDNLGPAFEWLADNTDLLIPILAGLGGVLLAVVLPALVSVAAAAIAAAAPFILLGVAIAALVAGFIYAYNNSEPFRAAVDAIADALKRAWAAAVDFIESIDWEQLWRDIQPTLEQARDLFIEFADKVGEVVTDIIEWLESIDWEGWSQKIQDAVQQVIDIIEGIDWAGLWADVEPTITQVKEIFEGLVQVVQINMDLMRGAIELAIGLIQTIWDNFGEHIKNATQIIWDTIAGVVQGALDIIQGYINVFIGVMTGDWERAWEGVKQIWSGAFEILKSLIQGFMDSVQNTMDAGNAAIKTATQNAWEDIKTTVNTAVEFVKGLIQGLLDFITGLDIWGGLTSGLPGQIGIISDAVGKINNLIGSIRGAPSVSGGFSGAVSGTIARLNRNSASGTRGGFRSHGGMSGIRNVIAEGGKPELLSFQGGGAAVALPPGTRVHSGDRTAAMLGGGGTTIVQSFHVEVHGSLLSSRDLERVVRDQAYRGSLDSLGGVNA